MMTKQLHDGAAYGAHAAGGACNEDGALKF
jgi:hypothetical protein